jgi:two-component system sensor kinase FixL
MNAGSIDVVDRPSFPELDTLLRLQGRLLHVSRLATIGEMSSGIAHELNQPLCAVANYAQACNRLLGMPEPDIEAVRASLQEITSQALRAGEIIRRLRSLARPQAPRHVLTDINTLLTQLADLVQSDAKHHRVRCRLELGAGLPQVWADHAQIQQLVLNLVHNAIEALDEVPPEAREIIVRTSRGDHGGVEVCVSDRGPGVNPTIAPHLFAPFYTTKSAGTGLGLAMSRTIARAHLGALGYRPNVPAGAIFTLTLPPAGTATQEDLPAA